MRKADRSGIATPIQACWVPPALPSPLSLPQVLPPTSCLKRFQLPSPAIWFVFLLTAGSTLHDYSAGETTESGKVGPVLGELRVYDCGSSKKLLEDQNTNLAQVSSALFALYCLQKPTNTAGLPNSVHRNVNLIPR